MTTPKHRKKLLTDEKVRARMRNKARCSPGGNPGNADDIYHDALVKILKSKILDFKEGYLTTATVNCSKTTGRRDAREANRARALWERRKRAASNPSAEGPVGKTVRVIANLVFVLPPKLRDACVLHYLCGLPVVDTAAALCISVPAAKKRLYDARHVLLELLRLYVWALEQLGDMRLPTGLPRSPPTACFSIHNS